MIKSYLFDGLNQAKLTEAMDSLETPAVLRVNKGTQYDHAVVLYPTPLGLRVIDPYDTENVFLYEYPHPITGLYLITEDLNDHHEQTNETLYSKLDRLYQV